MARYNPLMRSAGRPTIMPTTKQRPTDTGIVAK